MAHLQFRCRHRYSVSGFELQAEFALEDGITALVGPSGSGKTTILNLIAGLLFPSEGQIQLADRVLVDTSTRSFVRPEHRGVGVVFQDYRLFPHLNVEENLRYGLVRRPKHGIDFAHLVEVLGLAKLLQRPPQTLSGGQRQRTALGRALLSGPELLLLDEPVNAQDNELKEELLGYLAAIIAEYRIPTLLVSHDLQSVERLASRAISVSNGQIVCL